MVARYHSVIRRLVRRVIRRRIREVTHSRVPRAGAFEPGSDLRSSAVSDLAEFERSVTDAILVTRHPPGSPASHIARQFFDEALCRCAELRARGS